MNSPKQFSPVALHRAFSSIWSNPGGIRGLTAVNHSIVGKRFMITGFFFFIVGGLEAVISALVCRHGRIPPTINYSTPDPECDLDYGTGGAVERPVRLALSNSFGFGGHNVSLAIRRFGDE